MNESDLKHYLSKYQFRELTDKDGKPLDQFVSCPVRMAFAHLDAPRKKQSGGEVYSASFIIPPAADVTVPKMLAGKAGVARFGDGFSAGVKAGEYKWPLKAQGKLHGKGYDGFSPEGFFFEAQTKFEVPVFGPDKSEIKASNTDLVYSGMWCLVRCRVFTYPAPGQRGPGTLGVGFGLVSIQKIADDTEFKGGSAGDAFDEIEAHGGASAKPAVAPSASAFDFV